MVKMAKASQVAAQSRHDIGLFNQKAAMALTERGWSRAAIGELLDLSSISVWRYQNYPNFDYEAEKKAAEERKAVEAGNRTSARFRVNFISSEEDAIQWRSKGLRGEVHELLGQGMSQADIARYLGRSRQIVSYHVRSHKPLDAISSPLDHFD